MEEYILGGNFVFLRECTFFWSVNINNFGKHIDILNKCSIDFFDRHFSPDSVDIRIPFDTRPTTTNLARFFGTMILELIDVVKIKLFLGRFPKFYSVRAIDIEERVTILADYTVALNGYGQFSVVRTHNENAQKNLKVLCISRIRSYSHRLLDYSIRSEYLE